MSQPPDNRRQLDYVGHMLEAAHLAQGYVQNMAKAEFMADRKTQQAVILNILVIGEAATQLIKEYPDWATKHAEIPWRAMRGMRNRLAHGYFEINLDVVWDTVQLSLGDLEGKLATLLNSEAA